MIKENFEESLLDNSITIFSLFVTDKSFTILNNLGAITLKDLTNDFFKKVQNYPGITKYQKKEILTLIKISTTDKRYLKEYLLEKRFFEKHLKENDISNFKSSDCYYTLELISSNFSLDTMDFLDNNHIHNYGDLLEIKLDSIKNMTDIYLESKKEIYDTILRLKLDPEYLDDYNDDYELDHSHGHDNFD